MKSIMHRVVDPFFSLVGIKVVKVARKNTKKEFNDTSKYSIFNKTLETIMTTSKATRPWYVWGVLCAADLAKTLNYKEISIIEFGVAGGNGLLELEEIVGIVEKLYDLKIDIYGFDLGTGLPRPIDYRDLPNEFQEGSYQMDVDKLKNRLHRSRLILGPVEHTIIDFIKTKPKPVAFIAFDMDLYSSTMTSFKLLESDYGILLPRIYCYFDDIMGYTYSDFNGERLAIKEFNESHVTRKISPVYGLGNFIRSSPKWADNIYLIHFLEHDLYCSNASMSLNPALPLYS